MYVVLGVKAVPEPEERCVKECLEADAVADKIQQIDHVLQVLLDDIEVTLTRRCSKSWLCYS